MQPLERVLLELARTPVLLVAVDWEGVLAPAPVDGSPVEDARLVQVLTSLAGLPETSVALCTGSTRGELLGRTGPMDGVRIIGHYGADLGPGLDPTLTPRSVALLQRILSELEPMADRASGLVVESKPASVAFHFRNATDERVEAVIQSILDGPATLEGVEAKRTPTALELSVARATLGNVLGHVRMQAGASRALFLGPRCSVASELAGRAGADVAVRVGADDSGSNLRLRDEEAARSLLIDLVAERGRWLGA